MKKTLALAAAGLLALGQAAWPAAFQINTNYAGYREFTAGDRPFVQIGGCWQSPALSQATAGSNPQIAVWVGINLDTSADGTAIQSGVVYTVGTNGTLLYQGFYEKLPLENIQAISATTYPIVPGDIICSSLTCTLNCTDNAAGQTWATVILNCKLKGPNCASPAWTYSRSDTYSIQLHNAEWIVESLAHPVVFYPYGVYGCIPFTNSIYNNKTTAFDYSFESVGMNQSGTSGNPTANPSLPSSTGDGFSVCWGTGGVQTTPPTGDPVYLPGLGGRGGHGL